MKFAILIVLIAIAVVVAWNVYPPFREKMRGHSTIAETVIGGGMYYAGILGDAIKEAQAAGYIPEWAIKYLPGILLAWIIIKRIQTATPIGGR